MGMNATLVVGWKLEQLAEVRQIDGPPRFSPTTGKPVANPIDALFVMGKQVEVGEYYPGEWKEALGMDVFSTGSDREHGKGLRMYDPTTFVVGVAVGNVSDDTDGSGDTEQLASTVAASLEAIAQANAEAMKLIEAQWCKLGCTDAILAPTLYLVLYCSY